MTVALGIDQLRAEREHRIERGHRILEDHGDPRAAQPPHLLRAERQQVFAFQHDAAGDVDGIFGQQAEQRQRQRRLAAAAFADDPDDASPADRQADVAQRMDGALRRREIDREILDLDERSSAHGSRLSFGSIASRRLSPNSVKPSVASVSMPPATSTGQIDCSR